MSKAKEVHYLIEHVSDNSRYIIQHLKNGQIFLHTLAIVDNPFSIEGEDREVFLLCILSSFEETGFRFIKEL